MRPVTLSQLKEIHTHANDMLDLPISGTLMESDGFHRIKPSHRYCESVPRVEEPADPIDLCEDCWRATKKFLELEWDQSPGCQWRWPRRGKL
jgi:hypothetical protein